MTAKRLSADNVKLPEFAAREGDFQAVIRILANEPRIHPPELQEHCLVIRAVLVASAAGIFRRWGFSNAGHLAQEAGQEWFCKMGDVGFKIYRVGCQGRLFYPFAFAVLKSICCSMARKRRARAVEVFEFDAIDTALDPGRAIEAVETHAGLWREVLRLPGPLQEAIILKYRDGLSSDDAAGKLGISTNAFNGRTFRGREHLKRSLAGFGPD